MSISTASECQMWSAFPKFSLTVFPEVPTLLMLKSQTRIGGSKTVEERTSDNTRFCQYSLEEF